MAEHVGRESLAAQAIPVTGSTTLFVGTESHRVAVGIVAVGNEALPGLENEYGAYRLLRGNAYANERQHFPTTTLARDWIEIDADDERSIHFGLYENIGSSVHAIGAMRLIIKTQGYSQPLPVERRHPEAFVDVPSPLPSAEVSLLICRHEDDRVQKHIAGLLVVAGLSYALERGITAVFGTVETGLAQRLRTEGALVVALSEPRFVRELNTVNTPIRIDAVDLLRHIRTGSPDPINPRHAPNPNFTYFDVSKEG